jgi:hypothetical protein
LVNPETNRNLELDCYNDELKIGLEYNGAQHYVYPNAFHKSEKEFISQVRRDEYKHRQCDKRGVYLITVPYDVTVKQMEAYIRERLPDKTVCADHRY